MRLIEAIQLDLPVQAPDPGLDEARIRFPPVPGDVWRARLPDQLQAADRLGPDAGLGLDDVVFVDTPGGGEVCHGLRISYGSLTRQSCSVTKDAFDHAVLNTGSTPDTSRHVASESQASSLIISTGSHVA